MESNCTKRIVFINMSFSFISISFFIIYLLFANNCVVNNYDINTLHDLNNFTKTQDTLQEVNCTDIQDKIVKDLFLFHLNRENNINRTWVKKIALLNHKIRNLRRSIL